MNTCSNCLWYKGKEGLGGRECEQPENRKKWKKGGFSLSVRYKKPNNKACKHFRAVDEGVIAFDEVVRETVRNEKARKGTTKWLGLWAQERKGFYAGQVIKKTDIPKYTRIVLRYNKFYEKDSNRPKFVYCFADSEGYESKCIPIELEEKTEGERLYTYDEVYAVMRGACMDGHRGYYPGDLRVEDYVL